MHRDTNMTGTIYGCTDQVEPRWPNAPFFIVGLARSRTAWLANLLSYGDKSFCFHDLLRECVDADQYFARLDALLGTGRLVGDADSGLLFVWREVAARYPDARWVIVERPRREAFESWLKYDPTSDPDLMEQAFDLQSAALAELKAELPRLKPRAHVLHPDVKFKDLDDMMTVTRIWQYCLRAVPFDRLRFEQLDAMRVNLIRAKVPEPPPEKLTALLDSFTRKEVAA